VSAMTNITAAPETNPDRHRLSRSRKLLLLLLVIGAVGAIGVGTFASFNATTSNGGNTFQTGTIFLSNTVNTGSACFSYGTLSGGTTITNGNSNPNCQAFVNVTNAKPGDPAGSAVIRLADTGSLDGNLSLQVACANGTALAIHGSASAVCNFMAITIQPCATYTCCTTWATTKNYCVFASNGVNQSGTCPAVGFSGSPDPVNSAPTGSWANLASSYASATALTDPTAGNAPVALTAGGAEQAYQVTWRFIDSGVAGYENPAQGTAANLTVTWSIA